LRARNEELEQDIKELLGNRSEAEKMFDKVTANWQEESKSHIYEG